MKNIKEKLDCHSCGYELDEEDIEYPYKDEFGDIICSDCYHREYMSNCPICEDYFDKVDKPEDHRFIISVELSKEIGTEPGIYQVIKYPYYYGDIVSGFDSFFPEAIKLERTIDIKSVLHKLGHCKHKKILLDAICKDCYETLMNKRYYYQNYVNLHARVHKNINERAAIIHG